MEGASLEAAVLAVIGSILQRPRNGVGRYIIRVYIIYARHQQK